MSFNVKSNSSVKEVVTPGDRRGYTKLYGSINQFWSKDITLYDNIYNYSRIVIIGYMGNEASYGYYNLNYDIIPEISAFGASQTILLNNNNLNHVLLTIKNCSKSSNNITLVGQLRKSDTVNNALNISSIYGIK